MSSGPSSETPTRKLFRREQVAPRLVDQRAVGLKGVLNAFAVGVFPLELHGPAVEIDAQQQRLAAVPQNWTVSTSLAQMYCLT